MNRDLLLFATLLTLSFSIAVPQSATSRPITSHRSPPTLTDINPIANVETKALGASIPIQLNSANSPLLYQIGDPTDEEQLYLELINRARADPGRESMRLQKSSDSEIQRAIKQFEIDLTLMVTQFRDIAPSPPLSFSPALIHAARGHSNDMLDHAFQRHTGSNGSTPQERINAAGYGWDRIGENVFSQAKSVEHGHAGFEVDWGGPRETGGMQSPPGHRITIHDPAFREIGIGVALGTNGEVGPQVVTEDFGSQPNFPPLITGVAYFDFNGNHFYDVGEGIGGLNVQVAGASFYAVTAVSGGFSVPVPRDGTYSVRFSGPGLGEARSSISVSKGSNAKLDFIPTYTPPSVEGPLLISASTPTSFNFSNVAGATRYQWRSAKLVQSSVSEGAEDGLQSVSTAETQGYDVLERGIASQGAFSFHLAQPNGERQILTFKRVFLLSAGSTLDFSSRLGIATPDQRVTAQISTDNGLSWQIVWEQFGTGDSGESIFHPHSIALGSFNDREILVRFVFEVVGLSYFNLTEDNYGFYLDEIALTNAKELTDQTIREANSDLRFVVAPTVPGELALAVRGNVSNRWLPWGPNRIVTVSSKVQSNSTLIHSISFKSGKLEIEFSIPDNSSVSVIETTSSLSGSWSIAQATIDSLSAIHFRATIAIPSDNVGFFRVMTR